MNRSIQNALVEDFGQPVDDNIVELRERGQQEGRTGGLEGLKEGTFATVASEGVRNQSDF